ncbi:MAG: TauD/TfdA family dioxygenase [Sphingomonadales bacterium]
MGTTSGLRTRPMVPFGTEVIGLDLDKPIGDATKAELRRLWVDSGILLFRCAGRSEEAHLRLSDVFGEIKPPATKVNRSKKNPLLMELLTDPNAEKLKTYTVYEIDGEPRTGYISWHWDQAFTNEIVRGAVLRMIDPPPAHGRTGFMDAIAAYDRLPDDLKKRIEGLDVVYHFTAKQEDNWLCKPDSLKVLERLPGNEEAFAQYKRDFPPVVHPMVITQHETGRKVLKLCPMHCQYILDMDPFESEALLREVASYLLDERHAYFHTWQAGDMMVWDNWRILHSVTGVLPGTYRYAQRTTLVGDYKLGRYLDEERKAG